MKAWLLDKIGDGVEKLRLGEAPDPLAGVGEVVLRVKVAGLNPADRYLAENQYPAKPSYPHVLGRDALGVVEAVGEGVEAVRVGGAYLIVRSEVGVNRAGTFAERVAVPAESLVPVPAGWSDEEAAGAVLVYLTAYQALTQWGEIGEGLVLISGASGGVGVAGVQLARAMGHGVIGLSRDGGKSEKLLELGCQAVFDPRQADWPKQMLAKTGGRRMELAIDNIGGSLFSQMVDCLAMHGRISCVGRLAGPVPEFNTASLFFRRLKIGGVSVGSYTAGQSREVWQRIVGLLEKSGARPLVDSVHAFDALPAAFARLKQGPMGKVLLRVAA